MFVVIPIIGYQVAASSEATRCSSHDPEGDCDLAGVAGIGPVFLIWVIDTVLVCCGLVVWLGLRFTKRRRSYRQPRTTG